MSVEAKTIVDKTKEFFGKKLEAGFQVKDKMTAEILLKDALSSLNLSHGHRTRTKKILREILERKGISTTNIFEKKIEGFDVKLVAPPKPEPEIKTEAKSETSKMPLGGTPEKIIEKPVAEHVTTEGERQAQETIKPKKQLSDETIAEYDKILQEGFGFVSKIYMKLGLVEVDEKEEEEKPLTKDELEKEFRSLGTSWANYCGRHGIELPVFLDTFMMGAFTFFILGAPLLKLFVFGKKSKPATEDERLKEAGEN